MAQDDLSDRIAILQQRLEELEQHDVGDLSDIEHQKAVAREIFKGLRDGITELLGLRDELRRHSEALAAEQRAIEAERSQDVAEQKRIEGDRARLFNQVAMGREQLQVLSRQLVEVQEAERRTMARELHDEIGQTLTGLKLMLEMHIRETPDATSSATPNRLDDALVIVTRLLAQVREMSLNLRPTMLDDLGLLPALLWFFERYESQTGVHVDLKHSGLEKRLAPPIETAAYRIVQEALTNVARHSGVSEVQVRLLAVEERLSVSIEDQGAGFAPEAVSAMTSSGLTGMRERMLLAQGQLTIQSAKGAGTRILAELPLSDLA